jgi:hypothetical protein
VAEHCSRARSVAALSSPWPFAGNADQIKFWAQFVADFTNLGVEAVSLLVGTHDAGAVNNLIQQIQTFEQNANGFRECAW